MDEKEKNIENIEENEEILDLGVEYPEDEITDEEAQNGENK